MGMWVSGCGGVGGNRGFIISYVWSVLSDSSSRSVTSSKLEQVMGDVGQDHVHHHFVRHTANSFY